MESKMLQGYIADNEYITKNYNESISKHYYLLTLQSKFFINLT